jgi:hypothetical protein
LPATAVLSLVTSVSRLVRQSRPSRPALHRSRGES